MSGKGFAIACTMLVLVGCSEKGASSGAAMEQGRTLAKRSSRLLGKWRLIESSEAKGKTANGIPSYIQWETVEFTEDGREISTYQHNRSPAPYSSEIRYEVRGDKLTRIAERLTLEWTFTIQGETLEIRRGNSFEKYRREGP